MAGQRAEGCGARAAPAPRTCPEEVHPGAGPAQGACPAGTLPASEVQAWEKIEDEPAQAQAAPAFEAADEPVPSGERGPARAARQACPSGLHGWRKGFLVNRFECLSRDSEVDSVDAAEPR